MNSRIDLNDPATCRHDPGARSISYFTRNGMALFDRRLAADLLLAARTSGQNARLSLHADPNDLLHEMVIVQHASAYNRPKKHPDRPKSWHMIDGSMAIFAFDDEGRIIDEVVLDAADSVLYRLPAGIFHTNIPISDQVIHHETILGPFKGDGDRVYAPFAPDGSDPEAARLYTKTLLARLDGNRQR